MNYNKTSTKRRLKQSNSKGAKIKNKVALTILKVFMVAFVSIAIVGCAAVFGVAKVSSTLHQTFLTWM